MKHKKKLFFLICFFGLVFMNCYNEKNLDITIKIDNNSSQDLHISFYPNTFTNHGVGVTYKYNNVNVKKGESVSLLVKYQYKERIFTSDEYKGPECPRSSIQKIIFSKPGTGEIIKEVYNSYDGGFGDSIFNTSGFNSYFLEITDGLLTE